MVQLKFFFLLLQFCLFYLLSFFMSSYFSSCCILLNLLTHFLRWESTDLWVCQLPWGTDGLPLGQAWPLKSFSFTSLGGEGRISNTESVLNVCLLDMRVSNLWQLVSTACVCATWVAPKNCHHRHSQCSCIRADRGKKSTWKKMLLFWVFLFSGCTFVFYLEGHSSQHASMSGCSFLVKGVFLQMSL